MRNGCSFSFPEQSAGSTRERQTTSKSKRRHLSSLRQTNYSIKGAVQGRRRAIMQFQTSALANKSLFRDEKLRMGPYH
ncbi:hypothetical protein CEXT_150101 [Caerostris extrusa]|uniref:Uncharacterized protein n=1 Tax=Caerostris extrusa TaxID=172846 RepID=A0AAV4W883_CAEEX|nr:hypothetical protein CEXT_150101 [Caerostris extrusa]